MAINSETLSSLRTAVRDVIKEPAQAFVTDLEINRWLGQGQLKACVVLGRLEGIQSISMVNGTASYSLPVDFKETIDIQYSDGTTTRLLRYISPKIYRNFASISASSFPTSYTIIGELIYIYPTPDNSTDTASHRYIAHPTAMSQDTDVPYNDIERFYPYHLDLVDFAVSRIKAKKGDFEGSAFYLALFKGNIKAMVNDLAGKRVGGKVQFARNDMVSPALEPPSLPSNY